MDYSSSDSEEDIFVVSYRGDGEMELNNEPAGEVLESEVSDEPESEIVENQNESVSEELVESDEGVEELDITVPYEEEEDIEVVSEPESVIEEVVEDFVSSDESADESSPIRRSLRTRQAPNRYSP